MFRNQRTAGAPHERVEEVVSDTTGIEAGHEIVIPKQPSRGSVGGNPWIFMQRKQRSAYRMKRARSG